MHAACLNQAIQSELFGMVTFPETNIAHENPIFPGKYHQNDGFSMAMLVYRSVSDLFKGCLSDLRLGFV